MAIDKSGAYFLKSVGAVNTNTVEEQERAVTYLARYANDADDLRMLLDQLKLRQTAKQMVQRSA